MSAEFPSLRKPPAVRAGAGVGVIAPASFAKPERVERGLEALRLLGFAPHLGESALARGPLFFAGTPAQRLADLHAAFADEGTSAVLSLRGGYGSNYLLNGLDLELIASHPKPFFSYSDLTGVQLRLLDKIGLPAFHGPMVAADFYLDDGVHLPSFHAARRRALQCRRSGRHARFEARRGRRSSLRWLSQHSCFPARHMFRNRSTEGKLLFLEDTSAKPYQIDRMLWQLREAGKLDGVHGIVFGEMLDCVSPGAQPELLEETILSALDGLEVPIAMGLRSGHVSRQNVTLTFGVQAGLAVGEETSLHVRESAVRQ